MATQEKSNFSMFFNPNLVLSDLRLYQSASLGVKKQKVKKSS